ncbi:hypothetical protein F0L74_21535 [Chitinophaga agrisoli]|uniref:Uncharacterized protein n=1 Tax=Chitinophaga agrisoli TaxID=2607653 RepID=A0A5B2VKS4_9BACT|nr:hypothetical protein [Chitinophaga agrisoli]KAA2238799.1 hypothetical protein F0L74_21535 [Chitinophaga agrisoli]
MKGIEKERFLNDPVYEQTRKVAAEFARCTKAGKLLLDSAKYVSADGLDNKVISRLHQVMRLVIEKDRVHGLGMRTITSDGISLLRGFNFNQDAKLTSIFFAPFAAGIDRAAGMATITIPRFIPERMMKRPAGATHVIIVSGAAVIDFTKGEKMVDGTKSIVLPSDAPTGDPITLNHEFVANGSNPVFLMLGLRFITSINNKDYKLLGRAFNALSIVEVSPPA